MDFRAPHERSMLEQWLPAFMVRPPEKREGPNHKVIHVGARLSPLGWLSAAGIGLLLEGAYAEATSTTPIRDVIDYLFAQ
jgi:hypothetical protein